MAEDYVNHPSHYTYGGKECIDVIHDTLTSEEYAGYLKGTQIKYVFRHKHKWDPAQDLDKAEWYRSRYAEDFGYILTDDRKEACTLDFVQMYANGDINAEKLINAYITAISNNDLYFCELLLRELKYNLTYDNVGEDAMTNENSSTINECNTTPLNYQSTSTKDILDGLKFLNGFNSELWDNAYDFNYDASDETLTILSGISNPNVIRSFGESDLIPVEIKLMRFDSTNWEINIKNKH
jgi:hypothetical protein